MEQDPSAVFTTDDVHTQHSNHSPITPTYPSITYRTAPLSLSNTCSLEIPTFDVHVFYVYRVIASVSIRFSARVCRVAFRQRASGKSQRVYAVAELPPSKPISRRHVEFYRYVSALRLFIIITAIKSASFNMSDSDTVISASLSSSSAAVSSSISSAISSAVASSVSAAAVTSTTAQDSSVLSTVTVDGTTNVVTQIVSASAVAASTNVVTSVVTQTAVTDGQTDTAAVTVVVTTVNTASSTAVVVGTTSDTSSSASSTSSTPATLTNTADSSHNGSSGLSTGGKTAVAVVVPVVVVALLVLAGIFFWRKRKQRKDEQEARRKEVEDYGFNPNHDPTLPTVAADGSSPEMTQDSNSGYRGWGAAGASNRKASTTLSGGHTQGQLSDSGNSYGHTPSSPGFVNSDDHSGDPLVNDRRETMNSDDLGALGAAPVASSNQPIRRGPSNASSAYSNGARSEGSEEPVPSIPSHMGQQDYNPSSGYGYGQHGPYGDGSYGGGQDSNGMPVVRDVSARRNTRIQQGGGYGQGASGIAQNF